MYAQPYPAGGVPMTAQSQYGAIQAAPQYGYPQSQPAPGPIIINSSHRRHHHRHRSSRSLSRSRTASISPNPSVAEGISRSWNGSPTFGGHYHHHGHHRHHHHHHHRRPRSVEITSTTGGGGFGNALMAGAGPGIGGQGMAPTTVPPVAGTMGAGQMMLTNPVGWQAFFTPGLASQPPPMGPIGAGIGTAPVMGGTTTTLGRHRHHRHHLRSRSLGGTPFTSRMATPFSGYGAAPSNSGLAETAAAIGGFTGTGVQAAVQAPVGNAAVMGGVPAAGVGGGMMGGQQIYAQPQQAGMMYSQGGGQIYSGMPVQQQMGATTMGGGYAGYAGSGGPQATVIRL